MAFDGITTAAITDELNRTITGGKINKIAQPDAEELLITIKNNGQTYRLFLSANASLPLVYLTDSNRASPLVAPNFCMLLRKHIGSARILSITQPSLERVITFELEHLDELGDICRKKLHIEIMGKHSNIIFCDDNDKILDSIKRVPAAMSSVREVLPGRTYFIPQTQKKDDPLALTRDSFYQDVLSQPLAVARAVYSSLTGFSPVMAEELCHRADVDGGISTSALSDPDKSRLWESFADLIAQVRATHFSPCIIHEGSIPVDYSALAMTMYAHETIAQCDSISEILTTYYSEKEIITRMHQKSSDLRRIVTTALERNRKKLFLQEKQMKDTQKMEAYRLRGELIRAYAYQIEPGSRSCDLLDWNTDKTVTVPLDPLLSAQENAVKCFERYNKLKRTASALKTYLNETKDEINHLESVQSAIEMAMAEEDLSGIKEELIEAGYIRRKGGKEKKDRRVISHPYHYISSDGFDIYVGKNNLQNEELTFQIAEGNDWWFHAKGQPGSHVIVKSRGEDLPDRTFEEAGHLAAYYSKGRTAPKVEIDYIQKKQVKKPNGGKPGFVIYHTNYSMMIEPDIHGIKEVQ